MGETFLEKWKLFAQKWVCIKVGVGVPFLQPLFENILKINIGHGHFYLFYKGEIVNCVAF